MSLSPAEFALRAIIEFWTEKHIGPKSLEICDTQRNLWFQALEALGARPYGAANEALDFLIETKSMIQLRQRFTHERLARLRRLAGWADCPAPQSWNGTVDKGEGLRAVEDAIRRLKKNES